MADDGLDLSNVVDARQTFELRRKSIEKKKAAKRVEEVLALPVPGPLPEARPETLLSTETAAHTLRDMCRALAYAEPELVEGEACVTAHFTAQEIERLHALALRDIAVIDQVILNWGKAK